MSLGGGEQVMNRMFWRMRRSRKRRGVVGVTVALIMVALLMDIRLNGPPGQQGFWVQPAIYSGGGVRIDESAPSSGGLLGRLVLAR